MVVSVMVQECGKTVKIPDITPARRGRVNLHESIPERRNKEKQRGRESERKMIKERERKRKRDHRRLRENAGAREESQVPNRRGNETPGTNNKQANKNWHPPSTRRLPVRGALSASRFSNSPAFAVTW